MKVAITGHTSGIGKEIANLFPDHLGFSRSNGYDISVDEQQEQIISQSLECNVFINNAYFKNAQSKIFSMILEHWRYDASKTIVNIVSRAQYDHHDDEYTNNKRDLAKISHPGAMYDRECRIININPGWVATDRIPEQWLIEENHPYISSHQCAQYIKWAVDQDLEIGELAFWGTK